jgi:hypothetical protein
MSLVFCLSLRLLSLVSLKLFLGRIKEFFMDNFQKAVDKVGNVGGNLLVNGAVR